MVKDVKKVKGTKKISGFKGVFTNEMLQDYLEGEFKQSVLNWNNRVGNGVTSEHTCTQVMQKLINQSKRLIEECVECLTAYQESDTKERLDGLIDVHFVKVMVDEYYSALDKFSDEQVTEASLVFDEDDLLVLQITPQLLSPSIIAASGVNLFNPKKFYINSQLIIANNDQKYTTCFEKMLTWKSNLAEGTQIKTTEIDGVEYYSIVRLEDGKVMKSFDFEEVTLDLG